MTLDYELGREDYELIEIARDSIRKRFVESWHSVGAALRTSDGKIYPAVHIDANVGRIAVCAEAISVANALYNGSKKFDTIVAVQHPKKGDDEQEIKVVSPCGMCRELISDYDLNTKVIYMEGGRLKKSDILDLLPAKYR
jgi:cytidine deaminase